MTVGAVVFYIMCVRASARSAVAAYCHRQTHGYDHRSSSSAIVSHTTLLLLLVLVIAALPYCTALRMHHRVGERLQCLRSGSSGSQATLSSYQPDICQNQSDLANVVDDICGPSMAAGSGCVKVHLA